MTRSKAGKLVQKDLKTLKEALKTSKNLLKTFKNCPKVEFFSSPARKAVPDSSSGEPEVTLRVDRFTTSPSKWNIGLKQNSASFYQSSGRPHIAISRSGEPWVALGPVKRCSDLLDSRGNSISFWSARGLSSVQLVSVGCSERGPRQNSDNMPCNTCQLINDTLQLANSNDDGYSPKLADNTGSNNRRRTENRHN